MAELFAAVCSIAPTRRRRLLWAAWWTGPPVPEPFRKPDAFRGGARTREEALAEAERAAGRSLVEIEGSWARAWSRVLLGEPAWPSRRADATAGGPTIGGGPRARRSSGGGSAAATAAQSIWAILGVQSSATVQEIKSAFRRRALETHPDRGGTAEAFRAVQQAYQRALERRAKPRRRRKRA